MSTEYECVNDRLAEWKVCIISEDFRRKTSYAPKQKIRFLLVFASNVLCQNIFPQNELSSCLRAGFKINYFLINYFFNYIFN